MAAVFKIVIEDNQGNIYFPETTGDMVLFDPSGTGLTSETVYEALKELAQKATSAAFEFTLSGTSWTGTAAPFVQNILVDGILPTNKVVFDINTNDLSVDDIEELKKEGAKVLKFGINKGSLTVWAKEIPALDIPVVAVIVR